MCAYAFSVYAFWVIQCWDINLSSFDEPVVREHVASDGSHGHCVGGHEIEECCGVGEDYPRHHCPAAHHHSEYNASADVKIPGEEGCNVWRISSAGHVRS